LIRWELERRNPAAIDREWVAEIALRILDTPIGGIEPALIENYRAVVAEAAAYVRSTFIPKRPPAVPTDEEIQRAIVHALTLAKVDPLFRSATVDPSVNEWDPLDADDLTNLYHAAPWNYLAGSPTEVPLLNPEFGQVSKRFLGADADLIVGTTLIDFKATKFRSLTEGMLNYAPQLLGYLMISDVYRDTENPEFPEIHRAGIYYARHGIVDTFDADDVRTATDYQGAMNALFKAADDMVARVTKEREAGAERRVSKEAQPINSSNVGSGNGAEMPNGKLASRDLPPNEV